MARPKVPPQPERLPKHVVLIPDGNGRWAREHGKLVAEGHRRGAEAVKAFLRVCRDWGIPFATVWGFSTENWERSNLEVKAIMRLVEISLRRNRGTFKRDGMRFLHVGRRDRIARSYPSLAKLFSDMEQETEDYKPFTFNLALDYGGRDEMLRAIKKLLEAGLQPKDLTWEGLAVCLDTAGQPDPDLVIRSSGEHRLSGILPLQSVYAEIAFLPQFLPELQEEDFREVIRDFGHRERRFGRRLTHKDTEDHAG
ncbi:MAG: di-trans,poly-cis-decaprenylcistransferase [Candidatus Eisenbacteria sp.]|nr:di-trans,poly-cis-decaprenylcistransferase [Candidatus Eisenbacteria bacterium]